jgi:hypothetical protein
LKFFNSFQEPGNLSPKIACLQLQDLVP